MNNEKDLSRSTGFTILEVLIASVLIITLGIGILGMQYILGTGQVQILSGYIAVEGAGYAIDSITREVRTARAGDNGSYPIELADDNELIFYSDIDFDGDTEKVRYFLDGTSLKKTVINPDGNPVTYSGTGATKTLTDQIDNSGQPIFLYFNSDWPDDTTNNPLATPANLAEIRAIRIYISTITNDNKEGNDYQLDSTVQIRMLKDNL